MTLPIDNHEKAALQFSGGKDSLACLMMLRPYWDRLIVAWGNAGDSYPETLDIIASVRALGVNVTEVHGDAPVWIAMHGWPVDLLPVGNTFYGRVIDGALDRQLMQGYTVCCQANRWGPMHQAMRDMGVTLIIRGQRNSEAMKSSLRSGHKESGFEYWFPIEDWSEDDVFSYLRENGVAAPAYYEHTTTSLDCMHCTGWMLENAKTVGYLAKKHPETYAEVTRRLGIIKGSIGRELANLAKVPEFMQWT